jgi:hypothetical protein
MIIPYLCKIDTIENWKLISKNSSNGGGWKFFSKENVGNVSYVLNFKILEGSECTFWKQRHSVKKKVDSHLSIF